jgi:hypothetical protein
MRVVERGSEIDKPFARHVVGDIKKGRDAHVETGLTNLLAFWGQLWELTQVAVCVEIQKSVVGGVWMVVHVGQERHFRRDE